MSAKQKQTQSTSTAKILLAGGVAGGIEALIMYPTEFVKTQLQLQSTDKTGAPPRYTGVVDCTVKTVREKGVLSLYRGVSTLIVGSIPKTATRFAAFAQFKRLLADDNGKITMPRNALAGLGAGLIEAVVAVTPTETIKTKLIADANRPQPQYKGLVHGVSTMVRQGGIGSIYAGLVPTMLKQSGNQATRFTVYELLKTTIMAVNDGQWQSYHATVSGMLAGGVSVYVTMPFDVIKTRMQSLDAKAYYRSSYHCFTRVVGEEGVLALWRGTTPRLGRVMCSGGITFTAFELVMKQILLVWPDRPSVNKPVINKAHT